MRFRFLSPTVLLLMSIGCQNRQKSPVDDLNSIKKNFISSIFSSEVEEGPFAMQYSLETIFFSKDFISLFGTLDVCDCLPHGRHRYEGKSYIKTRGWFKEISLDDLFGSPCQKEFLRVFCEKELRKNSTSYFEGKTPMKTKVDVGDLQTFVVDDHFLIIVFQPYVVGGGEDGPFFVKIPFEELEGHWDSNNTVLPLLHEIIASKNFVISEKYFYDSWRKDDSNYSNQSDT